MKIELSDVSGLPEALKGYVTGADGKFNLDLGLVATDTEAWKGKAVTAQGESIDRRKALKAWEVLGATPDEVQAKLAKGADPAIIDQMRAQMADSQAAYKTKLGQIVSARALSDLQAELAKAGVVPEGLNLLAAVARQQIAIDDEGDVRVIGPDGKPMIGNGANGGATLADLALSLAKANPRLVADTGIGGGGKPAGSNGGTPDPKAVKAEAFAAMTQREKMAFSLTGGTIAQ